MICFNWSMAWSETVSKWATILSKTHLWEGSLKSLLGLEEFRTSSIADSAIWVGFWRNDSEIACTEFGSHLPPFHSHPHFCVFRSWYSFVNCCDPFGVLNASDAWFAFFISLLKRSIEPSLAASAVHHHICRKLRYIVHETRCCIDFILMFFFLLFFHHFKRNFYFF